MWGRPGKVWKLRMCWIFDGWNPGFSQLRLVVCPMIYRALYIYIPGGCLGFLNHQQYPKTTSFLQRLFRSRPFLPAVNGCQNVERPDKGQRPKSGILRVGWWMLCHADIINKNRQSPNHPGENFRLNRHGVIMGCLFWRVYINPPLHGSLKRFWGDVVSAAFLAARPGCLIFSYGCNRDYSQPLGSIGFLCLLLGGILPCAAGPCKSWEGVCSLCLWGGPLTHALLVTTWLLLICCSSTGRGGMYKAIFWILTQEHVAQKGDMWLCQPSARFRHFSFDPQGGLCQRVIKTGSLPFLHLQLLTFFRRFAWGFFEEKCNLQVAPSEG